MKKPLFIGLAAIAAFLMMAAVILILSKDVPQTNPPLNPQVRQRFLYDPCCSSCLDEYIDAFIQCCTATPGCDPLGDSGCACDPGGMSQVIACAQPHKEEMCNDCLPSCEEKGSDCSFYEESYCPAADRTVLIYP